MRDRQHPQNDDPTNQNEASEELVISIKQIREARDRDSRLTDDGGSSGRSDSNDNAIF